MTQPTHITQRNGASRIVLVDDVREYPDQIRYTLGRMNGTSFWAWSLWRAPEGADLLESLPVSDVYLQCAGSADAMTLELRREDADGTAHQYTVGRSSESADGPDEVIRWDDGRYSTRVHANEVFTADQAADAFYAYFLTDTLPDSYRLRELDLT